MVAKLSANGQWLGGNGDRPQSRVKVGCVYCCWEDWGCIVLLFEGRQDAGVDPRLQC